MESPSSLSFELHDFAALAREANQRGAVVIADNTYGPTLLRPLDLGANVSLNAATFAVGFAVRFDVVAVAFAVDISSALKSVSRSDNAN